MQSKIIGIGLAWILAVVASISVLTQIIVVLIESLSNQAFTFVGGYPWLLASVCGWIVAVGLFVICGVSTAQSVHRQVNSSDEWGPWEAEDRW